MSLRRRTFVGELTKRQAIRNIITGGIMAGILLGVWFGYPAVIDMLFGGSRGGYNPHETDPVPPGQPYDQTPIPFDINIVIDPDKFDPNVLDPGVLQDLFDPNDLDIQGDFSGFNASNWNIPLFYYRDIAWFGGSKYMRQNAYDTLSADGTTWTRSSEIIFPFTSENVHWGGGIRTIVMPLASMDRLNMRLPFFPYNPQYCKDTLGYEQAPSWTPLNDADVFYLDRLNTVVVRETDVPVVSGPANLTYTIIRDLVMDEWRVNDYKIQAVNALGNVPAGLSNFLQIPGGLPAYLNTHPNFRSVFEALVPSINMDVDSAHRIVDTIQAHLVAHYDLFTGFPERPAASENLIEWFLGRPRATHPGSGGTTYDFSSALVMLARAFGVPARLVIGYDDWDETGEITLANIYAWAECYLPQPAPSTSPWIVYEFNTEYITTTWLEEQGYVYSALRVDAPIEDELVHSSTGDPVPFEFTLDSTLARADSWYHYTVTDEFGGLVDQGSIWDGGTVAVPGTISGVVTAGTYVLQVWCDVLVNGVPRPLASDPRTFEVSYNDYVDIIDPFEGAVFPSPVNIALSIVDSAFFNTAEYEYRIEIDGVQNVTITSPLVFPFNVSGTGPHFVKVYMIRLSTTQVVATSPTRFFSVQQETGRVLVISPVDNSTFAGTGPVLFQYSIVNNASRVTVLTYQVWNVSAGVLVDEKTFVDPALAGSDVTVVLHAYGGSPVEYRIDVMVWTVFGSFVNSTRFTRMPADAIIIDTPAPDSTWPSRAGIRLDARVLNGSGQVAALWYAIDGGAPVIVTSLLASGVLNTTFDVLASGPHLIQVGMNVSGGLTVLSAFRTFTVHEELGEFITMPTPVNNTVQDQPNNQFDLSYTVTNSSRIVAASYQLHDNLTGLLVGSPVALPLATSHAGTITAPGPGTFYVVATITTEWGSFSSLDTIGRVVFSYNLLPGADFVANVTTIVAGQAIQFTHLGTEGEAPTTYEWVFGDMSTNATVRHPVHVYTAPGTYSVRLTVIDGNGDVRTLLRVDYITVLPDEAPDATFVANSTSVFTGQPVQFTHVGSQGNLPATFQWDFGDGSGNSTIRHPVHAYLAGGLFTVTLTIVDTDGDMSVSRIVEYINVTVNLLPDATFSANSTSIESGAWIQFTHVGTDGDPPATYQWNFGDGSANATTKHATHQYVAAGTYTVTFTVRDRDGEEDVHRLNITVTVVDHVDVYVNGLPYLPVAVPDSTAISILVHVYHGGGDHDGVAVFLHDVTDNVPLGNGVTNSSGMVAVLVPLATMQSLSTGVHAIRATASLVPAQVNYTYFAIDRPTSTTVISVSHSPLIRHWNSTLQGTLFTVVGTLQNGTGGPVANAWVEINLDSGSGGAGLLFTALQVTTALDGSFSWSGRIASTVDVGPHVLVVSFTGVMTVDGRAFTFTSAVSGAVVGVNVSARTVLSVDFNPKPVDLLENLTISGYLRYDNGTAIAGQDVAITLEFMIGGVIQAVHNYSAVTNAAGYFEIVHFVLDTSDTIRVLATFTSATPVLASSSAVRES